MSGCERVGANEVMPASGRFSLTQIPGALVQIPRAAVSCAVRVFLRCREKNKEVENPPSKAYLGVMNNVFLRRTICSFLQPGIESACAARTCRNFRSAMKGHCERVVRLSAYDLEQSYWPYSYRGDSYLWDRTGVVNRISAEIFKRCKNVQQFSFYSSHEKVIPSMPSVKRLAAECRSMYLLEDVDAFARRFPSLQDCAIRHATLEELDPFLKRIPLRSLHLMKYSSDHHDSCLPCRGTYGRKFSLETTSECHSLRWFKLTNFHIADDLLKFIVHKLPCLERFDWTAERQDGVPRYCDGDFFNAVLSKWPEDCRRPPAKEPDDPEQARALEKIREYVTIDLHLNTAELATLRKLSSSWEQCLQFLLERTTVVKWKDYAYWPRLEECLL